MSDQRKSPTQPKYVPVSAVDALDSPVYREGILDYDARAVILHDRGYEYLNLPYTCAGSDIDGHSHVCGWGRREGGSL